VLDVAEEEARALLLSIDPLTALAETQEQLHQRLLELTLTDSAELASIGQATAESAHNLLADDLPPGETVVPEQWLILVTCRDEKQQAELLERFRGEGLECKALLT
jgi:hypothetical protein